jgi:hypothetical protein
MAIQRYLDGSQHVHGSEARLLLVTSETSISGLHDSWQTLRTVMEMDPGCLSIRLGAVNANQQIRICAVSFLNVPEQEN